MSWKNIIGQQETINHLHDMLDNNRLSHALLFLGKEGCGALPIAIEFAKDIICIPKFAPAVEDLFGGLSAIPVHNTEEQEAVRHRANQLIHPDLHFTFPVFTEKPNQKPICADFIGRFREFILENPYANVFDWLQFANAENKQGNITAEECNDIITRLSLKAFEGEYKVLIIWMAEYLGKEGNKLLKIIEEPPPNTLFFLVAENEEGILPTILSRCQLVKIPQLRVSDIEKALVNQKNIDSNTAVQIASLSQGNYREALMLLQHTESDWIETLKLWLGNVLRNLQSNNLKWIDETSQLGRENQKQMLKYFIHLIEQAVKLSVIGENNFSISNQELDFAKRLNSIANIHQLNAIVQELNDGIYYIERNANGKMLFQALSIKMFHIFKNNVVPLVA